jgi:hypothetical protein
MWRLRFEYRDCHRKSDRSCNVKKYCSSHSLLNTVPWLFLCALAFSLQWQVFTYIKNRILTLLQRVQQTPISNYLFHRTKEFNWLQTTANLVLAVNKGATLMVWPCPNSIGVNCWLWTFDICQLNLTYAWSATMGRCSIPHIKMVPCVHLQKYIVARISEHCHFTHRLPYVVHIVRVDLAINFTLQVLGSFYVTVNE